MSQVKPVGGRPRPGPEPVCYGNSKQKTVRTRSKNPFELEAKFYRDRKASVKTKGDAIFLDGFPFRSRRIVASRLNGLLPRVRRVFATSSTDVWFEFIPDLWDARTPTGAIWRGGSHQVEAGGRGSLILRRFPAGLKQCRMGLPG